MTSGACMPLVLIGERANAVLALRDADRCHRRPAEAAAGRCESLYAESKGRKRIHARTPTKNAPAEGAIPSRGDRAAPTASA